MASEIASRRMSEQGVRQDGFAYTSIIHQCEHGTAVTISLRVRQEIWEAFFQRDLDCWIKWGLKTRINNIYPSVDYVGHFFTEATMVS